MRHEKTIQDFGDQWTHFTGNEGYHASLDMFRDIVEPLLPVEDLKGAKVADIGSGTGRIVRMLSDAGAGRIVSVEPSVGFEALKKNTADISSKITYLNVPGDKLPSDLKLDYVVSLGVIHHIDDPEPVMAAAYKALKPGGKMLIWVYGREGNGLYLTLALPMRKVTTRLSHESLLNVSKALAVPAKAYIGLCEKLPKAVPLPMRDYMSKHLGRISQNKLVETIYDQLNPEVARYYTRSEAEGLMTRAGFKDVRSHHRHGYSWTVIGTKKD